MSKNERPKLAVITPDAQRREQALRRRLPKPIITLQKRSCTRLRELLNNCFSDCDDHFFDLAKNAQKQEDQDNYFCAMRELRGKKSKVFETFFEGYERRFTGLAEQDDLPSSQDAFRAASVDQLAIVGNDDLDALVAKEAMVNRTLNTSRYAIEQLACRFDAIVPVDVSIDNLPVSPASLCDLFAEACKTLDMNARAFIIVFKVFERTVLQEMQALYHAMNNHLEERGILPSRRPPQTNGNQPSQAPTPASGTHHSGGLDLPVDPEFIHLGVEFPHPGQPQPGQSSGAFVGQPSSAGAPSQPVTTNSNGTANTLQAGAAMPPSATSTGGFAMGSGSVNQADVISHIFELMTSSQNIAAPLVPVLQQLQQPISRLAQQDASFFSQQDHVARRLLNTFSSTALAFGKSADAEIEADPIFNKMKMVARKLNQAGYLDSQSIATHLQDFEQFTQQEQHRADLYEKRMLDAERGKHASQVARKQVQEAIAEITQGMELRRSVRHIIEKAWHQVMFVIALKFGCESKEWDDACQTLIDLVTSTQPYVNRAEREHGLKSLKGLKIRVRRGLESLFFDAFETDHILQQLDDTIRLLAEEKPVENQTSAANSVKVKKKTTAKTSGKNTLHSRPNSHETDATNDSISAPAATAAFIAQAKNLGRGSWFDMKNGDGSEVRCRLAAIIGHHEKYIFVQRNGSKIADKTLDEVATALAEQTLVAMDSNKMFDHALEQVIVGMRK